MKLIQAAKRTETLRHALRDVVPLAQAEEKKGKKVLYLNIGDPNVYDYKTPKHIVEACQVKENFHEGYSNAIGEQSAREAVLRECERHNLNNLDINNIVLTIGASEGIGFLVAALINPGDDMLIPCPGYSLYNSMLRLNGGIENEYYLDEDNNWEMDVDELSKQITSKTKSILLINPNNPTGGIISKKTLEEVVDFANDKNLVVIADETYDKIVFDGLKHTYFGSLSEDIPVITMSSLSKNYLMPGYRAGWLSFNGPNNCLNEVCEAVKKLCRCRLSNVNPVQPAYEAAYDGPQDHIPGLVKKLQARRDVMQKRFDEIEGISCVEPKGAFYAYPKLEVPVKSDKDFCIDLLREKQVLSVFGSGFGQKPNTHHLRFVFLPNEEIILEAMDKLEAFIREKYF